MVLPPGRVLMIPVIKAGVHPVLNRLHQLLAKGQGHHGACQPLGRQVGDLAEKEVHLDHLLLGARLVWAGKQGAGFDTTNHSLCHPLLLSWSSRAGYDRPWHIEKAALPTMLRRAADGYPFRWYKARHKLKCGAIPRNASHR